MRTHALLELEDEFFDVVAVLFTASEMRQRAREVGTSTVVAAAWLRGAALASQRRPCDATDSVGSGILRDANELVLDPNKEVAVELVLYTVQTVCSEAEVPILSEPLSLLQIRQGI